MEQVNDENYTDPIQDDDVVEKAKTTQEVATSEDATRKGSDCPRRQNEDATSKSGMAQRINGKIKHDKNKSLYYEDDEEYDEEEYDSNMDSYDDENDDPYDMENYKPRAQK